jgi:hypothetical protein
MRPARCNPQKSAIVRLSLFELVASLWPACRPNQRAVLESHASTSKKWASERERMLQEVFLQFCSMGFY